MGFKRILKVGRNKGVENPLDIMNRRELRALAEKLQAENIALHSELTIQHERCNCALRVIRDLYNFMFEVVMSYVSALPEYRAKEKPIPALWLAARVVERFMDLFDNHPIHRLDIAPDKILLRNMVQVSMLKIDPDSQLAEYIDLKDEKEKPEAPAA